MSGVRKRIAILGGSGFVGRRTAQILLERGAELHLYSRHATELEVEHPQAKSYNLDIRLAKHLPGAEQYDAIINATGRVAGVKYNATHQAEMMVENFDLMRHAADLAARQAQYFVQISSACIYANSVSAGAREEQGFIEQPDAANYGYGWGKRMGEVYTEAKFTPEKKPFIILRPFNLYGPGDHFGENAHVIPSLIRKFIYDEEVQVWGDGQQIREFVYIDDLARAIATAIEKKVTGTVNVCGGAQMAISIKELVYMIEGLIKTEKPIHFNAGGPAGQPERFGNPERAQMHDMHARTPLADGLRKTILWFMRQKKREGKLPLKFHRTLKELAHAMDTV